MTFILTALIGLSMPRCPTFFKAVALAKSWTDYDRLRWETHRDPTTDEIIDIELHRIRFEKELLKRYLEFKKRLLNSP